VTRKVLNLIVSLRLRTSDLNVFLARLAVSNLNALKCFQFERKIGKAVLWIQLCHLYLGLDTSLGQGGLVPGACPQGRYKLKTDYEIVF
jgi:hypothetical protein